MLTWIRERAWIPATLLLVVGAGGIGLLDFGLRGGWAWASLGVGALVLLGLGRRYWQARRAPARLARLPRASLRVIQGSRTIPYDLEKDESTNNQRYLM